MTADAEPGLYTLGELIARAEAKQRPFWTCPVTRWDCRYEPAPVMAVILDRSAGRPTSRFQMYANADAAGDVTPHLVECVPGMTAHYLLDCWLHIGAKTWVDRAGMAEAMERIAWHFGDRSWSFARASGPRFKGRPVDERMPA